MFLWMNYQLNTIGGVIGVIKSRSSCCSCFLIEIILNYIVLVKFISEYKHNQETWKWTILFDTHWQYILYILLDVLNFHSKKNKHLEIIYMCVYKWKQILSDFVFKYKPRLLLLVSYVCLGLTHSILFFNTHSIL